MKVKIGKKEVSQFAQLECEKQLKKKLNGERGVEAGAKRPGIQHITDQGGSYEKQIYSDLIDILSKDQIFYTKEAERFIQSDLIAVLQMETPPQIILEAEFETPNIFQYDLNHFNFSNSRPDILYITKHNSDNHYIISIIDVKTTNNPSLKHFSEISFYKLVLEELLKIHNLTNKYSISTNGYIWPGNNEKYFFIDTFEKYKRTSSNPLNDTLKEVLIPVPYEIYEPYVLNFFNEILPRVNQQKMEDTLWQFSSKCQFCDYDIFCKKESQENSLIDQIPFISNGQHALLVGEGINNIFDLVDSIESETPKWQQIVSMNRNLKIQEKLILTRAQAIIENKVIPFSERKTYLLPRYANLNIFVTLHFDPISGLTFAMGASKEYKDKGLQTERDQTINIVKSANGFDTKYERDEFLRFLQKVNGWIQQFLQINKGVDGVSQTNLKSIHFYFWSQLEIKQLRRMMLRHLDDPKVQKELDMLISLYPPDGQKDDPELYETQPGTVVQEAVKYLFGLPIKYDYTLFDVANSLLRESHTPSNPEPFQYHPKRGFYISLSDQIPFERAYEIWTNEIFLPREFQSEEKYKRHEIEEMLMDSIDMRLNALKSIVTQLQIHHKDKLLLNKKKVKKFKTTKNGMEKEAINLQIFEKLNHISKDIENKQLRVLPIDEKENRFMSIRGLIKQDQNEYIDLIKTIQSQEEFQNRPLSDFLVFSYSKDSIEAKIKAGDFLVALSNEKDPRDSSMPQLNLDTSLIHLTGKSPYELGVLAAEFSLKITNFHNITLNTLSRVTIAYVSYDINNLFLILVPNDYYGGIKAINFLSQLQLIDLSKPMILDPVYQDFNQKTLETVFRTIGKK